MIAAWVLNLYAMWVGLWSSPRAMWQAFARGRHSQNLYGDPWSEALLDQSVGDTRRRLALERAAPRATLGDALGFASWSFAALALAVLSSAPLALLVWAIAAAVR
jgi:hypothetical protein